MPARGMSDLLEQIRASVSINKRARGHTNSEIYSNIIDHIVKASIRMFNVPRLPAQLHRYTNTYMHNNAYTQQCNAAIPVTQAAAIFPRRSTCFRMLMPHQAFTPAIRVTDLMCCTIKFMAIKSFHSDIFKRLGSKNAKPHRTGLRSMFVWKNTEIRIGLFTIEVSRKVNAPAKLVWDILTDTSTWSQWGPSVIDVEHDGRHLRPGSKGRVKTVSGIWAPFKITKFDNDHYWSWKVFGVPATGHRVDDLDDAHCNLIFEIPLFAGPYAAVCKIAADRIAELAEMRLYGGKHV